MTYLANSFSLQMLQGDANLHVETCPAETIPVEAKSCVGHPDTAAILTEMLNRKVEFNRESIRLDRGDVVYVAQVVGGRLPEGTTTLPEGVSIKFLRVTVEA